MNTIPLYLIAIGFFIIGGVGGLLCGIGYLALAVTMDHDMPAT